jgi:polysaccharide export outer membrane protein
MRFRLNKKTRFRVLCILGLVLTAVSPASAQQNERPDQSYKVLPGDLLQISVWGEEDLQGQVLVRPDGGISFPLCGDISAKNRSVVDLQEEIASRLSRYVSDPVVTVSVAQVQGNKVYVIGQVARPGVFVVNPQVDVLQALSMAGGTTPYANLNDIKILRRTGERQEVLDFRYNDVINGRRLEQNIILQSGDIVIVP